MSYGPSLVQLWRQAGTIAAKLLKSAKPADMPVEQPTKFELVVNTRTAKAIGINLSPRRLLCAPMRWLTRPLNYARFCNFPPCQPRRAMSAIWGKLNPAIEESCQHVQRVTWG